MIEILNLTYLCRNRNFLFADISVFHHSVSRHQAKVYNLGLTLFIENNTMNTYAVLKLHGGDLCPD